MWCCVSTILAPSQQLRRRASPPLVSRRRSRRGARGFTRLLRAVARAWSLPGVVSARALGWLVGRFARAPQLVPVVTEQLGGAFKEIGHREAHVMKVLKAEEESFLLTLDKGVRYFNRLVKKLQEAGETVVPGGEAFHLSSSLGFPLDLTEARTATAAAPSTAPSIEGERSKISIVHYMWDRSRLKKNDGVGRHRSRSSARGAASCGWGG